MPAAKVFGPSNLRWEQRIWPSFLLSCDRSGTFRHEIEALQQQHKAGYEEFRQSVAASRVSFFDSLIAAEETQTQQR